jgi:hypothetical protein
MIRVWLQAMFAVVLHCVVAGLCEMLVLAGSLEVQCVTVNSAHDMPCAVELHHHA